MPRHRDAPYGYLQGQFGAVHRGAALDGRPALYAWLHLSAPPGPGDSAHTTPGRMHDTPPKPRAMRPPCDWSRKRRSPCGFSTPPRTKSIHSACRASPACITAASEDSLERRAPATWPTSTCARRLRRLLSRRQAPRARGEWAGKDYLPMRPFTMVREILPRGLSTPVIHTVTVSPTATTSLGCFTKRSASLEMWTRPS